MNIFMLDQNPSLAAQQACDMHVSKMVVETGQILSTVIRKNTFIRNVPNISPVEANTILDTYVKAIQDSNLPRWKKAELVVLPTVQNVNSILLLDLTPDLYKVTHPRHPCVMWTQACFQNFEWLYFYFVALAEEYTYRYGKIHMTQTKLLASLPKHMPSVAISKTISNHPMTPVVGEMVFKNQLKKYEQLRPARTAAASLRDARNNLNPPYIEDVAEQVNILDTTPSLTLQYLQDIRGGNWGLTTDAYKDYYAYVKFDMCKWTRRPMPDWFTAKMKEQGYKESHVTVKTKLPGMTNVIRYVMSK